MKYKLKERIIFFFQIQLKFLCVLALTTVAPIILYSLYFEYKIPYIEHSFILAIVLSQYILFDEKLYKLKLSKLIFLRLKSKLSRTPSKLQLDQSLLLALKDRNIVIGINILVIILLLLINA